MLIKFVAWGISTKKVIHIRKRYRFGGRLIYRVEVNFLFLIKCTLLLTPSSRETTRCVFLSCVSGRPRLLLFKKNIFFSKIWIRSFIEKDISNLNNENSTIIESVYFSRRRHFLVLLLLLIELVSNLQNWEQRTLFLEYPV